MFITQIHGKETYIFKIEDTSEATQSAMLSALADKNNDPSCNFDHWDAAEVAIKFGKIVSTKNKLRKKSA